MESSTSRVLAKRLWSMVRISFFMIRKGISKSKLNVHLHNLMNKRGKISAKVIIGSLMFHHHSTLVNIPGEYEFSCSNSPAYPSFHLTNKRKTHRRYSSPPTVVIDNDDDDDVTVVNTVQKLMEMLNNNEVTSGDAASSSSPALPGFGCSPMMNNVRQLRITDSPFPLKDADDEDSSHVDKEAEEFIQRFYAQLRLQNNMAAALEAS